MKCYWITYENAQGERWDEGLPYVAESEDDAERQMIVNGCGGDPGASIEELRAHYRRYFEADDAEACEYSISEAEGWADDGDGFPVRIDEAA